jgi:hypothetical protein
LPFNLSQVTLQPVHVIEINWSVVELENSVIFDTEASIFAPFQAPRVEKRERVRIAAVEYDGMTAIV